MTLPCHISLGSPALLSFSGPDAVRFLNGQMTQDVRKVASADIALPSCITDAKGRLQFRIWIHARHDAIVVECPGEQIEAIEARLTRYLIADEVEVTRLENTGTLHHLIGHDGALPEGAIARQSTRYGEPGSDWWLPAGTSAPLPEPLSADALETLRIERAVPAWGRELVEGLLPPEARLDASDISYQKGCYIGQEVISRIKTVGKINQRLARISFDATLPTAGLALVDAHGKAAGRITSIAPLASGAQRHALAYLARGAEEPRLVDAAGAQHPLELSDA